MKKWKKIILAVSAIVALVAVFAAVYLFISQGIVTEKFECCKPDNSGVVTEALISYMENYGPIETVDLTLFKTILDKILVDESGEIALKFINGAVLKKDMEGACDE